MDINNVVLVGRLTGDPKMDTPAGHRVAKFSLAVNDGYGDKEHTSFFNCNAWDKTADLIMQYVTKGQRVGIVGNLRQRMWEVDGKKNSMVEITVSNIQFLEPKKQVKSDNLSPEEGGYG